MVVFPPKQSDNPMFIHENFLLSNKAAERLYHDYAAVQPIIDYHNHLSPQAMAENSSFQNLYHMWVDGDHYKWRAMRANGVDERYCTGDAPPHEKFSAFAATVPRTLRNPIYHWTHLELKRFFNCDTLLDSDSAETIWNEANRQLVERRELTPLGILQQFQVKALCTTDDPVDDLGYHRQLQHAARMGDCQTLVLPAFRPDQALRVNDPVEYLSWIKRLEQASDTSIGGLDDLKSALKKRHDFFHEMGGRLSDHGCEYVPANFCDDQTADRIFRQALSGQAASPIELEQFSTELLLFLARLDAEKGWTNQFHTGVWRNNNRRLFSAAGRDIGCDSIADTPQGFSLGRFLDRLDQEGNLPKTIVYNLNPSDNYLVATMLGNFQDGRIAGKMQFGSGWWFLDQKEGMQWQLNTLSNTGLLSRFIGMLTDSRSFMSMPRHEYFRRILCDMLGRELEAGEIPNDFGLVGKMVADICYQNAKDFLGLPMA